MDIRQYLRQKGLKWAEARRPAGLTAVMNCPKCDDKEKKFGISLENGSFSCLHLNKCGIKGSWSDFQKIFGDKPVSLDGQKTVYIPQKKVYKKPEIKPEALQENGSLWLKKRGFTTKTIEAFKIRQKTDALMLPTYKDEEHVATKFRSINEKKWWNEKGSAPYLFNRNMFKDEKGQGLAITEGHFDCMALYQYGIPAVSVPNGVGDMEWIELEWEFLEQFQKIYLFFDNDEAGQGAVQKIVNRIGRWRCYNVILPYKDANECLVQEVTQEKMAECVMEAQEFDPEVIKSAQSYAAQISELFENPAEIYGVRTPWKNLNKIIYGWRECELTVWSGRDFSGKTSLLNEVAAGLSRQGEKVVIASMEKPPKRYLKWMLTSISGRKELSSVDVGIYLNEHLSNLYIVDIQGDCEADEIMNLFDFVARKYGVKHFILDSLMKVTLDGVNEYREQKKFINAFIDNVLKPYNAHGHLVAHSRKGKDDDEEPDRVGISGSSNISDLADNVFIVWRPSEKLKQKEEMIVDGCLFVKKCKETGNVGKVEFDFDASIKKFIER